MEKRRLMRIFLCLLYAGSLVFPLSAELYAPVRRVEVGVQTDFGISNNYFKMRDILTDTITLDLNKIARQMPKAGLIFDFVVHEKNFIACNVSDAFRLTFFTMVDGSAYVNMPKDLFTFLGKGYEVGESLDFSATGYGDVFAEMGVSFYKKILHTYGLTITPAYYVPLLYIDKAKGSLNFYTTEEGAIRAEASAPIDIYTAVDFESYDGGSVSANTLSSDIVSAMRNGGFDITLAAERNVLKRLDVGVFTRIPLIPGRMHYKMTETITAYFTADNLLQKMLDSEDELVDSDWDETTTYSSAGTKYVWRPFRIGAEAAWRPFGKWNVFRPKLALVARNPYTWNKLIVYPEYSLDAEFTLLNIVGLNFGTAYENRIFVQKIGFMVNAHVLQLDVKLLMRGADFANSFNWTGAGAFIGIKAGW